MVKRPILESQMKFGGLFLNFLEERKAKPGKGETDFQ